jgi:pyrroline-5-carboxylate reductase
MTTRKDQSGAVLLIGAGRMGGALLKGWLADTGFSAIHVVEPQPAPVLRDWARSGRIALHEQLTVPASLSAAVIALKPQILKNEAALLRAVGATGALIVSIAAGITTRFLSARLEADSPVARAMPNTPGAIGRGITALYADATVSPQDRALAERLMAGLGQTLWLDDESLMNAVTAVSGSGPAYLFLMAEALASAGRAQGLDAETAERLARATVAGAGALLDADPRAAAELRKEVTSPGGTTEAALKVLMAENGLESLVQSAVAAATKRGKELGS